MVKPEAARSDQPRRPCRHRPSRDRSRSERCRVGAADRALKATLTAPEPPPAMQAVATFTFARLHVRQASTTYAELVGEVLATQAYECVAFPVTLYGSDQPRPQAPSGLRGSAPYGEPSTSSCGTSAPRTSSASGWRSRTHPRRHATPHRHHRHRVSCLARRFFVIT